MGKSQRQRARERERESTAEWERERARKQASALLLSVSSLALTPAAQSRRFLRGAFGGSLSLLSPLLPPSLFCYCCWYSCCFWFFWRRSELRCKRRTTRAFTQRLQSGGTGSVHGSTKKKKQTAKAHESESQRAPENPTTTTTSNNNNSNNNVKQQRQRRVSTSASAAFEFEFVRTCELSFSSCDPKGRRAIAINEIEYPLERATL